MTKPPLPSVFIVIPAKEPKIETSLLDHPLKSGKVISLDSVFIKTRSLFVTLDFAFGNCSITVEPLPITCTSIFLACNFDLTKLTL